MNIQRLTTVLHPINIDTQVVDASTHAIIMGFTELNDYNAKRQAAEKWIKDG